MAIFLFFFQLPRKAFILRKYSETFGRLPETSGRFRNGCHWLNNRTNFAGGIPYHMPLVASAIVNFLVSLPSSLLLHKDFGVTSLTVIVIWNLFSGVIGVYLDLVFPSMICTTNNWATSLR